MPVLTNIGMLPTCAPRGGQGDVHEIRDAAIAWEKDRITWTGRETDLPDEYNTGPVYDAHGKMVIPGLIDCHTHLGFGGWREDEFEMRCQGKTYLEIARAGGGILSTVAATRSAGKSELTVKSAAILLEASRLGVTTMECKSGYGLDLENELKLLSVYRDLLQNQPVRIVSTFLGAHAFPPEFKDNRQGYIDLVINKMIPEVKAHELAVFCDVFADDAALSIPESRAVLQAGLNAGLTPKIHADQLSSIGGAELAAELKAVSADHLEQISDSGINKMAKAGVVAVSLPLASHYLKQRTLPARKLIEAGVDVAVATDFNPGSAPSYHLPMAMTLACTTQSMTPSEALKGATIYAAKALNMQTETGSIEPGKLADFTVIDAPNVNHWLYHFRANACTGAFIGGVPVWGMKI